MMPRTIPVGEELPPMDGPEPAPSRNGRNRHESRDRDRPKGKTVAGERFKVLNTFVDFTLVDLSRAEIAVWLVLYRDTRDGTARVAMADLARRAGCSRRHVVRAVARLEKLGLVKVIHRGGFRRGASRYRVLPLARSN
jgi:predicted transcriptional regulator